MSWCWCLVLITDRFIPQRFGGFTIGPTILVRPRYRDDQGLLEHEKVHVRQFWRSFALMGLFYLLSPSYRLRAELEAYAVQLKYSPGRERLFARFIAEKYRLDITEDEAYRLLKEGQK